MTTTNFELKYITNVGFSSDQGGRSFQKPGCFAIRKSDGRIFVGSRGPAAGPNVGLQMVSVNHDWFGKMSEIGRGEGQMMEPSGLALDQEENIYVSDESLHRVSVFDRDGEFLMCWGEQGTEPGQFEAPAGLLILDENLYVVDARNHRIQIFSTSGSFLSEWGCEGSKDGEFSYPWGITSDTNGDIYVADWGNDRIQKFTSKGDHIASYGKSGSGAGQFNRPADIAVATDGKMYVADWGNQRLQVLNKDGSFITSNKGEAVEHNPWLVEYFDAVQDEKKARETFVPYFEVDTDDPHEISARLEPYFWDPCNVLLDDNDRVYVLESVRDRFQVFQIN